MADSVPVAPGPASTVKVNPRSGELGSTGLARFGQHVHEEFLPDLRGPKAIKVFREMSDNDPVIGAALLNIEMLVRQVEWRVDPASSSRKDRDWAKFVEDSMNDMSYSWADTLAEILSFLPYGWSYHEIVYKRRGGLWGSGKTRSQFSDGFISWRKIPIRGQSSLFGWEFNDDSGDITHMIQQAPPKYETVYLPIERSLLFRTTSHKNNPEGRSILRNAYRPWYFKKHIEEIEGIGVERDLAGIPTAYVDPVLMSEAATPDEKALLESIKTLLKNVRNDQQAGIIFPRAYDDNGNSQYDFELMTSGGARQFPTDPIITRYDQRIAMSLLCDFILLGHEKVGSFALSSDKTDLFAVALGTWLNSIAEVFNRHALPRLFKLNNWQPEKMPKIMYEDIESPDLTALGSYLQSLAAIGVPLMPDEDLDSYLRSAAHLPARSDETKREQEAQQAQAQPCLLYTS